MAGKVLIGNWKMNKSKEEALSLFAAINDHVQTANYGIGVGIAPPFPYLGLVESEGIMKVAQNCSEHHSGAFTGEVSASMLASVGCQAVLVGHSERRQFFGDTNEVTGRKVRAVLDNGLIAIVCCGESLEERKAGTQNVIVERQLSDALSCVRHEEWSKIIVAYEPVWAIGTGETASPAQAGEMHAFIREFLSNKAGSASGSIPLLYGGSCNAANAAELFAVPDVDGGLIGGASLKPDEFIFLIKTLEAGNVKK